MNRNHPKVIALNAAVGQSFFRSAGLASLAEELNPPPSREDFEPMTWAAIERGRRLTAASLAAATRDAVRVSYALAQCFDQFDAIITRCLPVRHCSSGHCEM
jgi:Asp-tRNA(Asn)/Glu-tRNA(Gln) amidotransferase A subunit family amidase